MQYKAVIKTLCEHKVVWPVCIFLGLSSVLKYFSALMHYFNHSYNTSSYSLLHLYKLQNIKKCDKQSISHVTRNLQILQCILTGYNYLWKDITLVVDFTGLYHISW